MPQLTCSHCSKAFERSAREIRRTNKSGQTHSFCSRSCSTTFNNKVSPKRKRSDSYKEIYETTLKRSAIRKDARNKAKTLGWNSCKKCGYNKHIEVAHIKPVNSFPKDSTLEEINHPDNLLPLCPNCHWEFDHPV